MDTDLYLEQLEFMKPMQDFWDSVYLKTIGIKCGYNSFVHKNITIVRPDMLTIGDNVRIDGYSVLSGKITFGSNIHVASHVVLMGGTLGIEVQDYSNIAAGCKIYTVSDDMNGRGLIGPQVPEHTRYLKKGKVTLEKYSCMAINSTMMPGTTLAEGAVLLATSVLTKSSEPYQLYMGTPATKVRNRSKDFLKYLEQ